MRPIRCSKRTAVHGRSKFTTASASCKSRPSLTRSVAISVSIFSAGLGPVARLERGEKRFSTDSNPSGPEATLAPAPVATAHLVHPRELAMRKAVATELQNTRVLPSERCARSDFKCESFGLSVSRVWDKSIPKRVNSSSSCLISSCLDGWLPSSNRKSS